MALTETDIKIIIAAELKKQGFDKAEKATSKLEKSFKRLGGTIVSVFAARKLIQFTRDSAQAFAEEDRAVRSLATSMENLGLAFQGANIEGFVSDLQRSVAVSDSQLRPALQQLVNATLDVGKAQQLLALALDISAATGKDLTAVTNGLSRAYLKDLSALSRLNVGLTAAQLKTMSFEEAQAALADRFAGQAAAAADSYAGKVAALNIAFDEAQETIGQKFVRALEILGDGDFDKVIDSIANAADKVGDAFIRASFGIQKVKALLKGDFSAIQKLQEAMELELAGGFGGSLGAPGIAQQMQKQLKTQKQIVAERKKAADLAAKEKKNQELLTKAKSKFDLEQIQIQAALQGKITEEERTRLLLMQAISTENAGAAEQLLKKLQEIQAENIKLAKQLTEYPKANDPFADWTTTLTSVQAQLLAIAQKKIVVDFLANFSPISSAAITAITKPSAASSAAAVATNPAAAAAAAATDAAVAAASADAAAAKAAADLAAAEAAIAAAEAAAALAAAKNAEEKAAAEAFAKAAAAAAEAAKVLEESAAAMAAEAARAAAEAAAAEAAEAERIAALLEAEAAAKAAADALAAASIEFDASVISAIAAGAQPITTITVNVEGSVTAVEDLAQTIIDIQYENQRNGTSPLFSSTAI
jgi:hypothetical protein